jgi:Bacterial dnaA protein helix-turn-helix
MALANGIASAIIAALPFMTSTPLLTDWMTMLGSSHVDIPPQSLPRRLPQCRRAASLLTDEHLRHLLEQTVMATFAVPSTKLWGCTRGSPEDALARQAAMYLAHVGCGLTFTEIGRLFQRDRTTVAHACGRIEDRRESVPFDRALELLEGVVRLLASRPA